MNFSILVGKILIKLGAILKRGSSLPGMVVLKLNKNIFKSFKLPSKVIAVTGSSGKGSTTSMIAKMFRNQGYTVTHNDSGSNLSAGILTTLLKNSNLKGKIKTDVVILEVDERYTKYCFKDLRIDLLVITNITRDQPPRQGHFDLVFEEIKKSINKDMTLLLNGDDPYLRKFENSENKILYYGIDQNKYSYTKNMFMNLNINYCPKCNKKLEYDYYNFENNGGYHCSNCSFKRPELNYIVSNINYEKNFVEINNHKIFLPFNMLFCIYNTLTSYAVGSIFKLDENKMVNTINNITKNNKIYNVYNYNNRKVTVLNNKNENSSTFNQSLLYISRFKEEKVIVIGWKEISRRYNFDDLSWLYDIDFEILNDLEINRVICVGIHRYDIATRIKLSGINEEKIITFENLGESIKYLKNETKGNIYGILNFDYVKPFNEFMIGSDYVDN